MKLLLRLTFVFTGVSLLLGIMVIIITATPIDDKGFAKSHQMTRNGSRAKVIKDDLKERPSFSVYADIFKSKDVFESSLKNSVVPDRKGLSEPVPAAQGFVLDAYKIVGILIDQKPQVVLEDKKTRETFFLSIGEHLKGVVVEEIFPGKVIFSDRNNKIELISDSK